MNERVGERPTATADEIAPRYRPDIDGLRAIAVTSVVLYHAGVPFLQSGFVGVDIFFVISGFLIGGIIYRGASADTFSFATFYARRARRILPALLAVIVATMLAGAILLSPAEYTGLSKSAAAAAGAVSNIRFWKSISYFTPTAELDPMLMTWSLGVEEQFYIAFPFVLLALRHRGLAAHLWCLGLLSALSFAACVVLTKQQPSAAFYLLPTRAWELGVGTIIAVLVANGRLIVRGRAASVLAVIGLAAIAASLTMFDHQTPFPGVAAMLPVFGAAALLLTETSGVNTRLLSNRAAVGVGLISYSWYLWHWPVMAFMRTSAIVSPSPVAMGAAVIATFAMAVLSWRFIEQPFRHAVLPNARVLPRYAVALVAIIALPVAVVAADGVPSRVPADARRIDSVVAQNRDDRCLRLTDDTPLRDPQCFDVSPGRGAVALVGDSHAAALTPAVRQYAARHGWGVAELTKSSCRPLLNVTIEKRLDPAYAASCERYVRRTLALIERTPEIRMVILAGLWSGPIGNPDERYVSSLHADRPDRELLALGVEGSTARLTRAGKRVVVMQDVPYWPFDPARAALIDAIPARRAIQSAIEPRSGVANGMAQVAQRRDGSDRAVARGAAAGGARFVRTRDLFCRAESCRFRGPRDILFVDRSHLSAAGANRAIAGLGR
ncbi:acyltransferase [Sphingomonas sp. SUN019]|uniref:acyltransferase family protein n=1 Tax=Sphingomonas sp. SUN019 TaxID=2937788 RepID=UPI002164EFEF|nr:acyltransferase family protein [Sphingomonas sp. SUN019]UVO50748.1 acyltransferase [Sphingomonas sp. SUN019]